MGGWSTETFLKVEWSDRGERGRERRRRLRLMPLSDGTAGNYTSSNAAER